MRPFSSFHLDQHDTWTLKFYDILEQFSYTQLVNTPTHIQGHILDALCVRDSFFWAISPKVTGGLSDHQAIMFSLIFPVRESNLIYCFAGAISSPLRGTQCASNKNHFL